MKGAACQLSSRSSLLLSCVGLAARAGAARNRLPGSVRSSGRRAAVAPVFVCTGSPDGGLRLPGDPPIQQSGRAGSSTTRGRSPEAWHGLAGCPGLLRGCGCFWPCARCAAVSSISVIEDLLEGTNPTGRQVHRYRYAAPLQSSRGSVQFCAYVASYSQYRREPACCDESLSRLCFAGARAAQR